MDAFRGKSYFANQLFVISGVLTTVLSCGLGLGYVTTLLQNIASGDIDTIDEGSLRYIETAGEIAFVPSIVVIPYAMQSRGRRVAAFLTTTPLLFGWVISYDSSHFGSLLIFNVLHHISLGGAVSISSIIISEFCSPKYRATFLMLETAMISLGVLISHLAAMVYCWRVISVLGLMTTISSMVVIHYWPESPYWLISQGHMVKCTENFAWLRGDDGSGLEELEKMMHTHKLQVQLQALSPIRKSNVKEKILDYLKSLVKADFLKPLSIMILLFSFVGFGGENFLSSYNIREVFKFTNGKYIGTIVLDVLTLICSLTACVLIQIVKRNTLFIFTSSFSIIFLTLCSSFLFLQSVELFSQDYMWILLSIVTGFIMFMSLGTTALPFSLLGEIFPMSYKGIGSSITCAYLWAFGNSLIGLVPTLMEIMGFQSFLLLSVIAMIVILFAILKILPETGYKTLSEVESLMKTGNTEYDAVNLSEQNNNDNFDRLRLYIEV